MAIFLKSTWFCGLNKEGLSKKKKKEEVKHINFGGC